MKKKTNWVSEFKLLSLSERRVDNKTLAKHILERNLAEENYTGVRVAYMAPLLGLLFGGLVYLIITNLI